MGNMKRYNLGELLDGRARFRIPLYQRSYAWGEREIDQLLEDLWLAFTSKRKNYYLGTLVVMQREGNVLEVVDGQQRLTTLTLLFRHLFHSVHLGLIKTCPLCFENRPDASRFLDAFFCVGNTAIEEGEQSFLEKPAVRAMAAACLRFTTYTFYKEEEAIAAERPYAKPEGAFCTFLKEQVLLYQITLPERTDIAKYFEVMNNRGVQLADVDVVKSRLMQQYKDKESQENFRSRWEFGRGCPPPQEGGGSERNPTGARRGPHGLPQFPAHRLEPLSWRKQHLAGRATTAQDLHPQALWT